MNKMRETYQGTALAAVCLAVCFGGCTEYIDPYVPEPIRPFTEPEFATDYLLYRPSHYDRDHHWPLIIACPGSSPDSPNRHIRAWTQLAESYGFLVAVPHLRSNGRYWRKREPLEQVALMRADERHILAVLRHVLAGHNISEDRVFLTGRSNGAYAALQTAIRHPDIFRALALFDPRFDERYMIDLKGTGDPHQPVLLRFQLADAVTGEHAGRCGVWLKGRTTGLTVDTHSASAASNTERAVTFFEEIVRSEPWIRIRAYPAAGDNPLAMQFKVQSSRRLTGYHWEFSDGDASPAAQPFHAFAEPGTYGVRVQVQEPSGTRHERTITVSVPEGVVTRPILNKPPAP